MAERRQRILAAARAIVATRGYEALTMRELAQASRVTVPTLYNLIGGKEAVLAAAVEEQTARFLAAIERRGGTSPAARLLAVVDACTRELLGLPAYYRTLLHLLYTRRGRGARAQARGPALGGELAAALRAIAEAGELVGWAEPTRAAAQPAHAARRERAPVGVRRALATPPSQPALRTRSA